MTSPSGKRGVVVEPEVVSTLRAIVRLDRSPAYEPGEPDPTGAPSPDGGGRWMTPAQLAE